MSARLRLLYICVCLLAASGCSALPGRKVRLDAAAGLYDNARLEYRVDAGRMSVPLAVARIEGQLVSYDQVASSPIPDQSLGTLSITYPHPSGRAGFAQARVVISGGPAETHKRWWKRPSKPDDDQTSLAPGTFREEWSLDISKIDLDRLIESLRSLGYLQSKPRPASGTEIALMLNGREARKTWDPVPELETLMQRVRREGQLIGYQRPATAASDAANRTSSNVEVYRALVASGGGGDARLAAAPAPQSTGLTMPGAASGVLVARLPGTP